MKILKALWQYWKWLCVALLTTLAALLVVTALVERFKSASPDNHIERCIENGGTWDEGEGVCKAAA